MNSHTCSCYMKSQGSKNFVSLFFFFSFLSRKNSFVSSPSGIWSSFICTLKYSVLVVALNLSSLKYVQPAASFFGFQFKLQLLHMVTVNWRIFSTIVIYICAKLHDFINNQLFLLVIYRRDELMSFPFFFINVFRCFFNPKR